MEQLYSLHLFRGNLHRPVSWLAVSTVLSYLLYSLSIYNEKTDATRGIGKALRKVPIASTGRLLLPVWWT